MTRDHDPEALPTIERTAPGAADPDAVPALARDLDRLQGLDVPHLAPLVRWTSSDAGVALVHRLPADAVPLDAVRRDGPLRAGHVLAVALAVAEALRGLHEAGLAHGGLDVGQVLVAPDGSVVLAAAGLGWRAAPGRLGGPTPEGDIASLGELVRLLLGRGAAPGPLVLAALRAADPDPSMRPDAAALLELLRSCGRPESLLDALWRQPVAPARQGGAAPRPGAALRTPASAAPADPAPRPTRRAREQQRRISFRTVAVVLLLAVVGAAAVRAVTVVGAVASERAEDHAVTASPQPPEPAATTPAQPSATTPAQPAATTPAQPAADWAAVLAALDAGRRAALESGDRDALARWVDPEGAAWARDAALLDRFARSKADVVGGELVLEQVHVQRTDTDRVLLAVRDRRTAYDVTEGGTTTHVPERAAEWWTVTLTALPALDGEGWRIAEVRGREDRAG